MKHAIKKLSELYTQSWLKMHGVDPVDEVFDAETAYQNKMLQSYFILTGLVSLVIFGSCLYLGYFGMAAGCIILSSVVLMGATHIRYKYKESNDLRILRMEWARERKVIASIEGLRSTRSFAYFPDIISAFEAEIRQLYIDYCEMVETKDDLKYAYAVKSHARHIYRIAVYCDIKVRKFEDLFR